MGIEKSDFQTDEMMYELHFLRVIEAIKKGWVTLEQVLVERPNERGGYRGPMKQKLVYVQENSQSYA